MWSLLPKSAEFQTQVLVSDQGTSQLCHFLTVTLGDILTLSELPPPAPICKWGKLLYLPHRIVVRIKSLDLMNLVLKFLVVMNKVLHTQVSSSLQFLALRRRSIPATVRVSLLPISLNP